MTSPARSRLVPDEMFSPALAATLRDLGHDVIAVAERSDLRAMTDGELFAWAASERRWLLTENVRDFRPILLHAVVAGSVQAGSVQAGSVLAGSVLAGSVQAGSAVIGVLFTSSRGFPRSRKNLGPLTRSPALSTAGSGPARQMRRSLKTGSGLRSRTRRTGAPAGTSQAGRRAAYVGSDPDRRSHPSR